MIDVAAAFLAWALLTCASIGFAERLYRRHLAERHPVLEPGDRSLSHVRILEPVAPPFDQDRDA